MKIILIILVLTISFLPKLTAKAASSSVVIGEISMGSSTDASDEYVVWHNNSPIPVDISGWAIQYKSTTGTSWSKKATVAPSSILDSHDDYVFATVVEADDKLTSGLAQAGGNIRVINNSGQVIDQLAWGNGDSPEGHGAPVCNPGESLRRKDSGDGSAVVDTDDNSSDFEIVSLASPDPIPSTGSNSDITDPDTESSSSPGSEIIINELLPDPATPLSDSADEFIELFNTSSQAANLNGWVLTDKSDHKYIIGNTAIAGHGYVVLYSKDTKISLNNSGDEIRLINPNSELVDSSPDYGNAKSGLSWGLVDGAWSWTVEATPGSVNASAITPETEAAAIANAKSKAKTTKAKTKPATKSAAKKIAASKKAGNTASASTGETESGDKSNLPWWSWLLIILGVGTIGYGIYEYRPEIKLFYHKLRSKLGFWRKAG